MALLFSKVTMTGDGYETEFLVGGIPREYEDLEGWCAADDFLEDLENESDIQVHADAYIYGEGETVRATPEEIAYFMKPIDMNPDFLSNAVPTWKVWTSTSTGTRRNSSAWRKITVECTCKRFRKERRWCL